MRLLDYWAFSQVLRIDIKISIKDFVQNNSLIFKTGRGFYEFTKPETVSHKTEVVLVDKVCSQSQDQNLFQMRSHDTTIVARIARIADPLPLVK